MDKEIKKKWRHALWATIRKYRKHIDEKTMPTRLNLCPLCITAKGSSTQRGCKDCIHNTRYSQNKHCGEQKSFSRISPDWTPIDGYIILPFNKKDIAYRIHVLKNIIKRLE